MENSLRSYRQRDAFTTASGNSVAQKYVTGGTMLKSIGLIILCNLLMYFIILIVTKINKRKCNKYSTEKKKDIKLEELNAKVNELEKNYLFKIF